MLPGKRLLLDIINGKTDVPKPQRVPDLDERPVRLIQEGRNLRVGYDGPCKSLLLQMLNGLHAPLPGHTFQSKAICRRALLVADMMFHAEGYRTVIHASPQ